MNLLTKTLAQASFRREVADQLAKYPAVRFSQAAGDFPTCLGPSGASSAADGASPRGQTSPQKGWLVGACASSQSRMCSGEFLVAGQREVGFLDSGSGSACWVRG